MFLVAVCAKTHSCSGHSPRYGQDQGNVATKDHKRYARGLLEALESRLHAGPPVDAHEILSARQFLLQSEFSPSSDYFDRLTRIQHRVINRSREVAVPRGKRNYGGEAGGYWMQLQSAYDHIILSTCYEGEFNRQRGRIKISHRFNRAGRIDFVELKFLRSLQACLTGELRKLLTVKSYQDTRKDWQEAEAFVLEVLPRELMFLYQDIFRCERSEVFAWLINIGHRLTGDLTASLQAAPKSAPVESGRGQLALAEVRNDEVARPILELAAALESAVEINDAKCVLVRYHSV
jgi:hypothetical protein